MKDLKTLLELGASSKKKDARGSRHAHLVLDLIDRYCPGAIGRFSGRANTDSSVT